jgi:DNA modification methylase
MTDKSTTDSNKVGEFVRINKLHPHAKNPRHNDHAVTAIANSIKRFGFTSPIVANKDHTILAGHTRWKAAKQIGLETVPVVYVDLSPVDAELLMIADNKLGEKADWNTDQLSDLLTGLREKGEDLEILGFDDEELSDLLADLDDDSDPFGDGETPEDQGFDEIDSDLDFKLLKGNCLDKLKELPDNSIDAIVTDPPYELGFMGKSWDSTGIAYSVELWSECLRVLKHGGHLVAFSGSRTVFPMGVAIAEAGFEVRDMISWIYTSGFPKSMNISIALDKQLANMPHRGIGVKHAVGQEHLAKPTKTEDLPPYIPATPEAAKWQGWGTALKPAQEPAVLARKPIDPDCSSIAENVLKWGTGAINIDAARFAYGDDCWFAKKEEPKKEPKIKRVHNGNEFSKALAQFGEFKTYEVNKIGRFPANVYQCSKPQRSEKEQGLDHLTGKTGAEATHRKEGSAGLDNPRAGAGRTADEVKNFHPTVKPIKLMRWLCRLLTPKGGTVLDPFLGSGTTAVSAILEGFNAIGCEMTEDYYPIIQGRVNWAKAERNKEILNGEKEQTDG